MGLLFYCDLCLLLFIKNIAGIIDINQRCISDNNLTSVLPECSFQIDLIRQQKCVENKGMYLVLDEKAKDAVISCVSENPIDVEIEQEDYLSYGDGDKFVVIHRRSTISENSTRHSVTIPIIHEPDYQLRGIISPIRKYKIKNANNFNTDKDDSPGIELMVISAGSGVLFSVGSRVITPKSEIVYIPCLYDYTTGIKVHSLSRYTDMGSISYNANPNTYDYLRGFRLNLTSEPNLYGNHTIDCSGEGPSVNPFLPGPAVYEGGYGVEFHDGLYVIPNFANFECYTPPCKFYCEYEDLVKILVSTGDKTEILANGRLLFKTFENVTRYKAEVSNFSKTKNANIQCVRTRDNAVLHTWTFSRFEILIPTNQTLNFKLEPVIYNGKNSSRILQCISNKHPITSFLYLPCGNSKECKYYSNCIHDETGVKKWQSAWTVPKYCSAPISNGSTCQSKSFCKEINFSGETSGRIFCKAENGVVYEADFFVGVDGSFVFDPQNSLISPSSVVMVHPHQTKNFYSGGAFWFSCESSSFYTEHGLQWKLKWRNGSFTKPIIFEDAAIPQVWSSSINPTRKSRIVLESPDVVAVVCLAPLIHKNDWVEYEMTLNSIQKSTTPTFNVPKVTNFEVGSNAELECVAEGYPPPLVYWILDKEQQKSNNTKVVSSGQSSTLKFLSFTEQNAGDYLCVASLEFHNATRKVSIAVKRIDRSVGIIVGVTLAVLLIALVALVSLYRRWKTTQTMLQKITDAELDEFLHGIQGSENHEDYRFVFRALSAPYNSEFEIDRKNLEFDPEAYLGSGQFGVVYKGCVKSANDKVDQTVSKHAAIKTLKSSCRSEDIVGFLSEVKLMIYLEKHPHLVEMIGACTKNCKRGEVYLALEFCDHGSLLKHLQNLNENITSVVTQTGDNGQSQNYANLSYSLEEKEFSDLIQWAYEISCGMDYMANKGLIHGDLAARNVLLKSKGDRIVSKISDFGLSRKLYEYTQYVKTKQEPLPWRWLAPETLRQLRFSTKSDVWAYAICMWEIFTLGDVPYSGYSYDMEFINMLDGGFRNPKPKYATDQLYDLMEKCWFHGVNDRPSFQEIKQFYETELKDGAVKICSETRYTQVI